MTKPILRKQLNETQIDILLALYKFRFATVKLIADYQGLKSDNYTYRRLESMVNQGYLGKRFTDQDRIDRKPATYYLVSGGIRVLRKMPDLGTKPFSNLYKDYNASPTFVKRCQTTFHMYNKLKALYGHDMTFYGKSEMSEYTFFPSRLTDGFMMLNNRPYLLELVPLGIDFPALVRRVEQLVRHFDDDSIWPDSGMDYPVLLFICDTTLLERSVQRRVKRDFRRFSVTELTVCTTTMKALFGSDNKEDTIWSDVLDPEEPFSLTNLFVNS